MIRKLVFVVILVSVLAMGGSAADTDNAVLSPSYFEGTWRGAWPFFMEPSATQTVTITIRPAKKEGFLIAEYEWGSANIRNRTIPAGSVKAKGIEEGEKFTFKWKNKQDRDFEITLHKHTDDTVKARIDRGGPLAPHERPFTETQLKRK